MYKLNKLSFFVTVTALTLACQVDVMAQIYGNATIRGFDNFGVGGVGGSRVTNFAQYATGINHASARNRLPNDPLNPNNSYFNRQFRGGTASKLSASYKINHKLNFYQKKGTPTNRSTGINSLLRKGNLLGRSGSDSSGQNLSQGKSRLGSSRYQELNARRGSTFAQKLSKSPLIGLSKFKANQKKFTNTFDKTLKGSRMQFGKSSKSSMFDRVSPFSNK
jgi:hypothetical protein